MRPASTSSGLAGGDDEVPAGAAPLAPVEGVSFASVAAAAGTGAGVSFGLALAAFGLAALAGLALAAAGFDFAPSAFAPPVSADGLAAGAAFAVDAFAGDAFAVDALAVDGFAVALAGAAEGLAPAARTVRAGVAARAVAGLPVPVVPERAEVVVDGIAVDIALAASVSDLTAVSIALVAALIACSAVVIVLAEDVAFVAAAFSFAAADVTLVAAEFTDREVVAAELVVLRVVAGRAALLPAVPALADVRRAVLLAAGFAAAARVAVFFAPAVDDVAELVRLALAVRGRVGFVAAGVVGTDLPPSGSVTGSLIPRSTKFYTSALLAHQPHKAFAPQSDDVVSASGSSLATAVIASSGVAPRPTATPMR